MHESPRGAGRAQRQRGAVAARDAPARASPRRVVVAAAPARAAGRDDWWGAEGILDWVANDKQQTAVASRVSSAYYSQEFVTYLSRFLLNSTGRGARVVAAQAATVPPSYGERRRFEALAAAFESFSSSVEYGLRRYPAKSGRALLPSPRASTATTRRSGATSRSRSRFGRRPAARRGHPRARRGRARHGRAGAAPSALLRRRSRRASRTTSSGTPGAPAADAITRLRRGERRLRDRGLAPFVGRGRGDALREARRGVGRERRLDPATYAGFALSGLVGCSATHAVLVPIDVVKTLLQTDRAHAGVDGGRAILREEGPGALFLGAEATLAGYCWYGLTVYPGYEFWSRTLNGLLAPRRRRSSTRPSCSRGRARDGARGARRVADDEGADAFYAGFRPLFIRQVIFGMVKFFFFDSLADAIFEAAPALADGAGRALAVSLVAGLVAGTASSLVSQPADAVLSRINADRGDLGVAGAVEAIWGEGHVRGFYQARALRVVRLVISGQFAIYDALSRSSPSRGRT
ncbi:hypothetical protein JL720_78 [Aureococcus anophagefferens]|nr:hypothetical protein JL720_78 [Aureococcus anophagefferens]